MYCSHCGKKVGDTMLFCPFCGDPIVIPEQDGEGEASAPQASASETPAIPEPEPTEEARGEASDDGPSALGESGDAAAELMDWNRSRQSIADEWARQDDPPEPFTPLELDQPEDKEVDWQEEIARKKQTVQLEKKPPEMRRRKDEPLRLDGAAPKLELDVRDSKPTVHGKKDAHKRASTLVPPKTMNPNDMFLDQDAHDDDYDAFDDVETRNFAEGFVYEDEGESSFFMRHLRGIVGLALFVMLLLMFVIYAFSKAGQLSLAQVNLAWSTEAYSQLGYQSYQDGLYSLAGQYYARALQRDPGNYSYASSAAMAYFEAGNAEKSAEMLKKCVEINPTLLEPYIYLLKLYPDAAQRPWDVTQLLQQGYRQTGDSRLNVTG